MSKLATDEEWKHAARKCIEELNELATVLSQQYNKPWLNKHNSIEKELADVSYRIGNLIRSYYDWDKISKRIEDKWG